MNRYTCLRYVAAILTTSSRQTIYIGPRDLAEWSQVCRDRFVRQGGRIELVGKMLPVHRDAAIR